MRFLEKYEKYRGLVEEGLIKEIYYNDEESICRFGNFYVLFNYKLEDMCVYTDNLGDLFRLAGKPKLLTKMYKQKKISGFKMTDLAINAVRQNAKDFAPNFNEQFEKDLRSMMKDGQTLDDGNLKGGR